MVTKRRQLRIRFKKMLDAHGWPEIPYDKTLIDAIADAAIEILKPKKQRKKQAWRKRRHARPMTAKELRALPYQEYLKTKHWDDIRVKARFDADYTCQKCGATDCMLHVHHKTYARLGREKPRDLRVLCAGCHKKVHGKD